MQKDLKAIHERNRRVELDKEWETSITRRSIIAILTYFIVVLFLHLIGAPNIWLNALVPVLGFLLSTMSMPLFRKMWERYR